MNAAIAQLRAQLDTLENNEPIHRAEGNHEQANMCAESAKDIRNALAVLEGAA